MKTYLDMDEILRHCRRYIGQEYDEPYLVSAVPEEVIRSLPAADVVEVRHAHWILHISDIYPVDSTMECSLCNEEQLIGTSDNYCPNCGAKMDNDGRRT